MAQAITALSQRLVQLEQRLESIEKKDINRNSGFAEEDMKMLDGVDSMLQSCKELLDVSSSSIVSHLATQEEENSLAA